MGQMPERQTSFRLGEATGRPLGGNVSNEAFPQALRAFAVSRGFESQSAFAKSLGKTSNSVVGAWFLGKKVPSQEEISNIFLVHQPSHEEAESLIQPWSILLQKGRGKRGITKGSEQARRVGERLTKQSETPLGRWFEKYAIVHKITLTELWNRIGIKKKSRNEMGIDTMEQIIDKARVLELDEGQIAELVEVVAQTIEEKAASGHQFKTNTTKAKIAQKDLACITYTPRQASGQLGITREAIRRKRNRLGLPLLMNEEQMEILRQDFEATREIREKVLASKSSKLGN